MGASSQKSIKTILDSKYSFVHPKSHFPLQISCWKFTEQQLESRAETYGQALRWPFKIYSDQGYIFTCIDNNSLHSEQARKARQGWRELGAMEVSVNLIEFLYSFASKEVEEYGWWKMELQNKSKYIKDNLTLTIYVYAGESLSSGAKLKLMTQAISLERYISRGGICAISKLYHQYEQIVDLAKQIKVESSKSTDFYLQISSLVEERIKPTEDEKARKELQVKQLTSLYEKLKTYRFLDRVLISRFFRASFRSSIFAQNQANNYPTLDCSSWAASKNLIIRGNPIKNEPVKHEQKKVEKIEQIPNLNESLPFACEITEINFRERKKLSEMEESMSLAQLSVLGEKEANFIKIVCEQEDYLILSDYVSIRQYSKCIELNVRMIINNSASLCYNYFINDFEYLTNYITPLPIKRPAEAILFEYNIEHLIEPITEKIINQTSKNKQGDASNNRVAIYSSNSPFSDENCALVIGYLICRYLYTYERAFKLLNACFREYKQIKDGHLQINKLYVDQLLTLEGRILITSLSNYGVSLSSSWWRVYQVSNNHCHPSHILIPRYIGQIANLNQLQSLPNHSHHFYLVVSHQIIADLSLLIEKWQKNPMAAPQGMSGLKILIGKEFKFKDEYLSKAKSMVSPILKYEFLNRKRLFPSFNNEYLLNFLQEVVDINMQVETIQKSFRKAQPFVPLYFGFEQESPGRQVNKFDQPYNSQQKLTFKYPFLRPTWEQIKDDEYYFIVHIRAEGASIQIVKGKNWIGLEDDKEAFFEKIIKNYMENMDESKIWVNEQESKSLLENSMSIGV